MSQQSDKDSLIALDALLNIRSSVRAGGGGRNAVGSQVVEKNQKKNMDGFSAGQLSDISGLLSLNASLGLPPPGTPAYHHLIAVQAAAIQSQHSPYSMVASPPGFGNGWITAGNQSTAQPESRNDERKMPSGDGTRNVTSSSATEKNNPAKEQVFRQEKVEAALRSKHQRGRKRDNLSVSERLELTRTRNREHAKSTRIRKKARYQELLDCEQKLLDMAQQSDDLKSQRQQSVKDFLSIREGMIQHMGSGRSSSGEVDKPSGSGLETKTDGPSVQCITNNRSDEVEYLTLLREVVESIAEFRYDASELRPVLTAQSSETRSSSYNMKLWDEIILSRFESCFGGGACRSLVYKVTGDLDGIAISDADNGFAHVDLVLNANGENCLFSGIMMVHFAPGSSRLHSAVWTTTADNSKMKGRSSQDESAALPDTLGKQRIYPSYVSLDHDKANEAEEAQSPGMHI